MENIRFNIHNEFHMLRHFQTINLSMGQRLEAAGYKSEQIQAELQMVGSKFIVSFANDISALLFRLYQYPYTVIVGMNGNHSLEFTINSKDFPDGIGTMAVLPIKEIPPEERKNIVFEENRSYRIGHLLVPQLLITNYCTLILKPLSEGFQFISAFPGKSAMPIPKEDMSKTLWDACKEFWDNHVFLKKQKYEQ